MQLVSDKPYNPRMGMPKTKVEMPPPVYVNVDSSYKPKRSMVKKYGHSSSRAKPSPGMTGQSFFSNGGQEVIKSRPLAHQPVHNDSERGGFKGGEKNEQKLPREPVDNVIP